MAEPFRLSKCEAIVVRLGAQGLTDKEIAERLGISTTTVQTYWARARRKVGSRNRMQCVALVMRQDALAEADPKTGILLHLERSSRNRSS